MNTTPVSTTRPAAPKNWFGRMKARIRAHKIITSVIVIVLVIAGYEIYKAHAAANVTPQYSVSVARLGTIRQTVTGSGQVSAENQLDVTSQVSGTVKAVNVSVGQHVKTGDLLATIDPKDALVSLQNAQIAYAKLVAPAKNGDLANAENSVVKSYSDAFNTVASTFVDLPTVMTGLKSMLYGANGYLSDAYAVHLNSTARPMRDAAGLRFDAAAKQYAVVIQEYQGLTRASATSSIDALLSDTYSLLKTVSTAVQETQNTVNYASVNQPDYYPRDATTAVTNLNSWSGTVNSDLASILSAQSTITSNANSLATLQTGADTLDVQSQQLSLQQAQENYAKYFIRAPFDGIVGRIPVSVYGQASASTVVATIVGDQKIATISLNEVDAAKVAVGQPVAITFDAIDGLTATGTVSQVDLVGTVTQGVVSYGVKITINTSDTRIKPGMSLNTTITTKEKANVLIVPSVAVKSSGTTRYLDTLDAATVRTAMAANIPAGTAASRFSSTTRQFRNQGQSASTTASTTAGTATTTAGAPRQFTGAGTGGASVQLAVTTSVAPQRVNVTVGDSDDTNTEITSGLSEGQFIITRTLASGSTASAAAPSILSGIGGNRPGGAARTTGGAAAGR
ncbi:MAG: family efflux transporter subunit, HlyD family secretion protein [Candidatus Parcubacteria bacterium]|nr:family efflux transporter subunit, HlyD family secretion protein [Candidatus Parcubacteria bacterium]